VIDCLKALQPNPLAAYLSATPPVVTLPAPATAAAATPAAAPGTAQ
jgi:hypothetical protein